MVVTISLLASFWIINKQEKPEASSVKIYVSNASEGTISVIDPVKDETIDKISLGTKQASHGIALSKSRWGNVICRNRL